MLCTAVASSRMWLTRVGDTRQALEGTPTETSRQLDNDGPLKMNSVPVDLWAVSGDLQSVRSVGGQSPSHCLKFLVISKHVGCFPTSRLPEVNLLVLRSRPSGLLPCTRMNVNVSNHTNPNAALRNFIGAVKKLWGLWSIRTGPRSPEEGPGAHYGGVPGVL